jgi:hypothetical protein
VEIGDKLEASASINSLWKSAGRQSHRSPIATPEAHARAQYEMASHACTSAPPTKRDDSGTKRWPQPKR